MSFIHVFEKQVKSFEGKVNHMYLDSSPNDKNVTVGFGCLISSADVAKKYPFLIRKDKSKASDEDIVEDFNKVETAESGHEASYYKDFTKCILPENYMERLFFGRIHSFLRELRIIYKNYDKFPEPAKIALLEMIYALGAKKLQYMFKNFTAAVRKRDWVTVAKESQRKKITVNDQNTPKRNEWVKKLLLKASKIDKVKTDRLICRAKNRY